MSRRLIPDAAVALARTSRRHPRDEVFARLLAAGEAHLRKEPRELLGLGPGFNFVAYSALFRELSVLFELTGEERYLDHIRAVLEPLLDEGWRSARFLEDHIQLPFVLGALALATDILGDTLGRDGVERVRSTMHSMATHLHRELTTKRWGSHERALWNHNIIGWSALGLGSLVLGADESAHWLDLSFERAQYFVLNGVTAAGMTWEGIGYCGFVLELLGPFIKGAEMSGRRDELLPPAAEDRLRKVPRWYAHSVFPRGSHVQNFNDAHWNPNAALQGFLATFAADQPDLSACIWDRLVGQRGRGTFGASRRWSTLAEAMLYLPDEAPNPAASDDLDDVFFCEQVGFLAARTGWDSDATVLAFNSGPLVGELHDQSDNNSFTFIARGEPLVIDSGAANRRTDTSPSSSLGHNLVFIDGRAEPPSGQGHGVSGQMLLVERHDDVVIATGDATESYGKDGYNPVRHALRHVVLVKAATPYLVTYDDIVKDDVERLYECLVHVPGVRLEDPADAQRVVIGHAGMTSGSIEVLHPRSVTLEKEPYRSHAHPFREHAIVRIGTRAVRPHFVMLLRPAGAESDLRAWHVDVVGSAVQVHLQWRWGDDLIRFPVLDDGEPADAGRPTFAHSGA